MKTERRVSVIILCHNQLATVRAIVAALKRQTRKPYEVIIADDDSSEPAERAARAIGCNYVRTQRRSTSPHCGTRAWARQQGLEVARGQIVVYLDGDMLPSPQMIELVVDSHARHGLNTLIKIPRRFHLTQQGRMARLPDCAAAGSSYSAFTSDCCAIGRESALSAGGWDPNFKGWGEEDVEFAYRCHLVGVSLRFPNRPDLFGIHVDHPVDPAANFATLRANAAYFAAKYPEILAVREPLWKSLGVYLASYSRHLGASALLTTGAV